MSKIVYVCARSGLPLSVEQRLREVCKNLEPDNIAPPEPKVVRHGNSAYGVMNPSPLMLANNGNAVIGQTFGGGGG